MGKRGQDHSNSMVVTRKRERKATACMEHKAIVSDSRVFLFYLGFIRTPQEVASPSASPCTGDWHPLGISSQMQWQGR